MPSPDVLLVGLGSTHGLRAAEDELAGALRRAGAEVVLARARRPREVRTFALTDLGWARAARRAAEEELRAGEPGAVVYLATTAALLWPRPGAIRFDAPAAANRPGRHGAWSSRRRSSGRCQTPWRPGRRCSSPRTRARCGRPATPPRRRSWSRSRSSRPAPLTRRVTSPR